MTKAAEKYSWWRITIFYSVSMSMMLLEEEKKEDIEVSLPVVLHPH